MQKSIMTLIVNLKKENEELKMRIQKEQKDKLFLSTLASDQRYTIKQLKELLAEAA